MRNAATKKGKGGGGRFLPCPPSAPGTSPCRRWHEEVVFLGHPRRAGGREENTPGGSRGGESGAPRARRRGPPGAAEPVAQTSRHLGRWSRSNTLPPREKGRLQHGDSGCNTATGATELPLRSRPRESHRQGKRECRLCALQPPAGYEHFPGCSTSRPLPPPPSFLRSLCTPRKRRRRDEEHFEQRSQALRPPSAGFGASPAPPALECPLLRFLGRVKPGGGDFPRPAVLIRCWGSSFSPGGSHQPRPAAPRKNTKRRRALGFWHFLIFIFFS